jgi:iron-sulfur cluster repair protein YtfE (RIC family)
MAEENKQSANNIGPAEKIESAHKKIMEEMWVLKKTVPYLYDGEAQDNIKEVVNFIKETLFPHFEWEEHKVFPIALVIGDLGIKQVVRELQQQHIMAVGKFDIMADLILKYGFSFPDENIKGRFIDTVKEMIEVVLENARKEDEVLFPFLLDKQVELDFKE